MRNILSILKQVVSFCETTERYPTMLFQNLSPSAVPITSTTSRKFSLISQEQIDIEEKYVDKC